MIGPLLVSLFAVIDTLMFTSRAVNSYIDVKENIYMVDLVYRWCKINPQNTSIYYSLVHCGERAISDGDNPMEPVLFFHNSGMLLITDNNPNTPTTSSLSSQNNSKPGGFYRANSGMVWQKTENKPQTTLPATFGNYWLTETQSRLILYTR